MVKEGIQDGAEEVEKAKVGALALLIQGIATSIDALSVGFTIAEYDFIMALTCFSDYCGRDLCNQLYRFDSR